MEEERLGWPQPAEIKVSLDRGGEGRRPHTPFARLWRIGVAATGGRSSPLAGSQETRIFFSWIADRSTVSHFVHTSASTPLSAKPSGTYDLLNTCKLLVCSNGHGLDEELVTTFLIGGGLLLHGLQENCEGQPKPFSFGAADKQHRTENIPETSTS